MREIAGKFPDSSKLEALVINQDGSLTSQYADHAGRKGFPRVAAAVGQMGSMINPTRFVFDVA